MIPPPAIFTLHMDMEMTMKGTYFVNLFWRGEEFAMLESSSLRGIYIRIHTIHLLQLHLLWHILFTNFPVVLVPVKGENFIRIPDSMVRNPMYVSIKIHCQECYVHHFGSHIQ